MKNFLPLIFVALAAFLPMKAPAYEADSVSVSSTMSQAAVRVTASGFEVHNSASEPCSVEVYALTGRLVLNASAPSGVTSFNLAPGHYIVRLNSKSTKIVVR